MPEKVRQLDALIDAFHQDTGALAPRPNPAFDPSRAEKGAKKAKGAKGAKGAKPADPLQ